MTSLRSFGLAALLALAAACTAATQAQEAREQSLYQRLGGYDAIAAVSDDFIGRLVADARFGRFFSGFSTDSKKRLRQLIVEQVCEAAGGPCFYTGRSMKASHAGLGITEAEWVAASAHMTAALDKFRVPQQEKDQVMALLTTLRPDIVEK